MPGSGPQVFLGWLAAQTERDFDLRPDWSGRKAAGIEIVSWHAAKGREWPVVVVSGLDQKFEDWPRTLRAEFESFDDLGNALSRASLAWTPDFAAAEVQARFLAACRDADERAACAALYVALTRARDLIVLSLLKAGSSEKRLADLLRARAGLKLGPVSYLSVTESFHVQRWFRQRLIRAKRRRGRMFSHTLIPEGRVASLVEIRGRRNLRVI